MSSGSSADNHHHHHHHPPPTVAVAVWWPQGCCLERTFTKSEEKKWLMVKWGDRYSALRLALTRAVCVGESKVYARSRAHVSAISSEDNWESSNRPCGRTNEWPRGRGLQSYLFKFGNLTLAMRELYQLQLYCWDFL